MNPRSLGSPDTAEEVARQNAEFFEMSMDHLCVAGFDGYWKRLNPSWARSLGFTAEELMSRPLIEFVHPDDRARTLAAREALKVGQPLLGLSNRYRAKDGTYRWFEWQSVSHVDRGLVYAVARDVTALREMQQQLILADRMASVGMLAAGVAHEINNPLAFIIVNLETLLEEVGASAAAPFSAHVSDWIQLLREMREGAERIRTIVWQLKTFSRAEGERRSVIDVAPVIEVAINMVFNVIRHRARLRKDYGAAPLVDADDSRLGQVFINLLVNAAQAIPEGDVKGNEIRIGTEADADGNAVIEIRDTGPGIPEDAIARIFDPFFTTKPVGVGTGLGLSICQSIVTSMGGRITAENGAKGGAIFRVVLPPARRRAATKPSEPTPRPLPQRRARILIIDDEHSVGDSLKRALRHDVTTTTSARAKHCRSSPRAERST